MNAFAITTGIGYRLFLIAPFGFLVTVVAYAIIEANEDSSKRISSDPITDTSQVVDAARAFMFLIPAGQGLGFAGAIGWFLTTRPHPCLFPSSSF